jgi:AhpD family alkylhydroperoxidase
MIGLIVTENELPIKSQAAAKKLQQLMHTTEIGNSNRALLLHPILGPHWMDLGEKLAFECDFEPKLRELIILRTAYFHGCNYELHYHVPLAKKSGITEDILNLLEDKKSPTVFPKELQPILKFCDQINNKEKADYKKIIEVYGREKMIAIISLIGFYTFLADFIYSFGISLP